LSGTRNSASTAQIRGSTLLLAGQAFAVLVNLAIQILIVRYLSLESYGAFAYALSIALIGEAVARFGMRRGAARYMPLYEEAGDLPRVAGTFALAVGTVLAVGLAVVLIVAGFRGAIAGSFADDSTAVTVLVLLALMAPIEALSSVLDGMFAVFGRPGAVVARRFVLTPLFRLTVVALLIAQDQDVVFLAVGYVATGLLGLTLYAPLLTRVLRQHGLLERLRPGRLIVPAREVFSFTVPQFSTDITGAVVAGTGAVMLGVLATSTDVAEFRAVVPVATMMGYVATSFGTLLAPLAARLYARSDAVELNRLYWRTTVWIGVLAFPIMLTCVVLGEPLTVLLFGDEYEAAGSVLAVLAVGQFVDTATGSNVALLDVFRRVRFTVMANLATIATILALSLALIPPFEAIGAAAATAMTYVVLNVIRQIGVERHTAVHGILPQAVPPFATMAAAAAAAIGIQVALSPPAAIGLAMILAATGAVFAVARHELALRETFPELERIPVLRRLVGATPVDERPPPEDGTQLG
jgi:O-antigen/teichoic acid export membrane protein